MGRTFDAQRVAAAVVAVAMGGIGFLPLFGGPGYEQSLASGLVVPSAAAIATALEVSGEEVEPLRALGLGVRSGLVLSGVAFVTALLHGARVGICDFWGGTLGFVLTAGFGAVLGGAWGAVVGEVARGRTRRRLMAVLLALAAPIGGVVVSLARFYTSPMIFAYDPFAGYFSGTLYDTVIDTGSSLVTYRAGSLATLTALALFASVLVRAPGSALGVALRLPSASSKARLALAIAALAASIGVTVSGPSLGHWQTSKTIADDLGGFRAGARCDVVYPGTMRPDEVDLLLRDCHEELASVEGALGAPGPEHVTAFFFRDAGDKKRLMGAADTYIAKPWRHEVYLQVAPYPHPVLGHELAHVVAGSFGRGPFAIAGELGGLWPNPGLIEGTAVAASPDDDELTDTQWSHAMLELGTLPPARAVFSIAFLGASAAKSYTVAGAFVRWVMGAFGVETVRAWYGGASIEALTHRSWDALDAAFREDVARTKLAPEAEAYAKAKFERPAIFGRKCPHIVDALRHKADVCRESQQVAKAVALYDDVLARDPHDTAAEYGRAVAELRYGNTEQGRRELTALAHAPLVPRTWRDPMEDALADGELLEGRDEAAAARYRALAEGSLDEDFGRTAEVKANAALDPRGRGAIEALLVGTPKRPPDLVLAAVRLGAWSEATNDPIALYLLGKNLTQRAWFADAAGYLDRALRVPAATVRIGRELLRQRAICACALGDAPGVARVREAVRSPGGPYASSEGRRASVLRLLARCAVP